MGTPPGWAGQGRRRLLGWEGADRPGPAPRNRGGTWDGTVAPLSSGGKHDRGPEGGRTPTGAATSRQDVAAPTVGAGPRLDAQDFAASVGAGGRSSTTRSTSPKSRASSADI